MEIIDNSTATSEQITASKSALFRHINLNVDIATQAELQEVYADLTAQIAAASGSLSDYYTKTEVDQKVSTEVAAVISGAPEAYDTLKEIADWIAADETGTAALVGRVDALEIADTTINSRIDGLSDVYDEKGAAATALTTANGYTDTVSAAVSAAANSDLTAETDRATNAETALGTRIDDLSATYKTITASDAADTAIKQAIATAVNDTRFATDAADDYADVDAIIADLVKVRQALGALKAINA